MPFEKGKLNYPTLVWKTRLPNFPPYAPESTVVFDNQKNLYFGCHDGCFYSLNPNGKIRWTFRTDKKVYSSPSIYDNKYIVFASGDGNLYCFDTAGNPFWITNIDKYSPPKLNKFQRLGKAIKKRISPKPQKISVGTIQCWASPNLDNNETIYIASAGIGLHAVALKTGEKIWSYDLGKPRFHLSGVALSDTMIIVPSQQRYLFCVSPTGETKWVFDSQLQYDIWANPSIDHETGTVYLSLSKFESHGLLIAIDMQGVKKWHCSFNCGIRSTATISYLDYVILCGLDGNVYFIDKEKGVILNVIKLTNAQRGLWTSASIDIAGNIFVAVKKDPYDGSVCCIGQEGNLLWEYPTAKVLSVPSLDSEGRLFFGNWNGEYLCLQT